MNLPVLEVGELAEGINQYKLPLFFGLVSVMCIAVALFFIVQTIQTHEPIEIVLGESTASASIHEQGTITVDVAGGVVNPGVYKLPAGSRMDEAILMAGGLSEEASKDLLEKAINRAQKINDGMKVYIPKKSNEQTSHNISSGEEVSTNETSYNNNSNQTGIGLISINSASQTELESLSGVGPATAVKIINARPYINIEELVGKKAVGQKLFEKIKANLTL